MEENKDKLEDPLFSSEEDFKVYRNRHDESEAHIVNNESILRQMILKDPVQGFELIFRRYYQPLCSHAARFVYSKEAAEDIVCEVFLHFWHKKLYENVIGTFRVYLYTAVRNSAFNYLKKEFKENSNSEALKKIELINHIMQFSPEAIIQYNELYVKIQKEVNQFPPQCQKVFILSRFEGKKNREIADELKMNLKTVEYHISKALSILKKALSEYLQ